MSDILDPPPPAFVEESPGEKSWRQYDHMSLLKRLLYLLGFGHFRWFRKWVGHRWVHRCWLHDIKHVGQRPKQRWEYHPLSTFKGCTGKVEDYSNPLPQARLLPKCSQEKSKISSAQKDILSDSHMQPLTARAEFVIVQALAKKAGMPEDRLGKFLAIYDEYLNGNRDYGDIELFLSGYLPSQRLGEHDRQKRRANGGQGDG